MKSRISYFCLLAGLIISSCSDLLHTEGLLVKEGSIEFSASNAQMITKSGLEYETFEVGTKYLLYGVEATETYDWTNAILNKKKSKESDEHLIDYGEDLHFRNKTYDFYGATICSITDNYPNDSTNIESAPTIHLNLANDSNSLDDLMYSNNLKGCTARDGVLDMNFIHALSKIQIEVSKQNESEELKYAKIHSLTIGNTHGNGNLDVVNGSWALPTETISREFSRSQISLSTTGEMVKDASGAVAEMLIFPNEDGKLISLEVEYSLDEEAATIKTASIDIYKPGTTSNEVFMFRQNHRYTLAVTIANDGVQVVTVLPKVYEWISEVPPQYLGQPVTFGNLMWMDRNLGAVSADYNGDWYNTIGHYFQFGRNIPYILDIEKFKKYTGDGYPNDEEVDFSEKALYVMKYAYKDRENEWLYVNDFDSNHDGILDEKDKKDSHYTRVINEVASKGYKKQTGADWGVLSSEAKTALIMNAVECIYTYDHLGNKVYGVTYVAPSLETSVGDDVKNKTPELVRSPDRIDGYKFDLSTPEGNQALSELYKFGFCTKKPGTLTNLQKPTVWTFDEYCGAKYWEPEHQEKDPCPKGWRLPTKEDLEVLMPTVEIKWDGTNYPNGKATTTTEDIVYGKTSDGNHICYILKKKGENDAYRLRIMSHYANDGRNNKRYFSISRYSVKKKTDVDGLHNENISFYLNDADIDEMWANPIETIYYPACGFIVPDGDGTPETVHPDLRSFGTGTVIRTCDSNPDGMAGADGSSAQGFSFVQYLSTTDYELSIQKSSRRSLGDQIRCVRDINAMD